MKTNIYLVLITALTLASCTDEDSITTATAAAELSLQKIEKFSPSAEAYTTGAEGSFKNVKYYNDNRTVADTTFDASGSIYTIVQHTYTANTYTTVTSGVPDVLSSTKKLTYDDSGRLTEEKIIAHNSGMPAGSSAITTFNYNSDGTITRNSVDPGTNEVMANYTFNYHVNANGLINSINFNSATSTFVYNNDKPVQYFHNNTEEVIERVNFLYYSTPVPSNMQRSVVQLNNSILENGFETAVADNCNYYLQSYEGLVTFNKTFNDLNYVTYSKATGTMHQEQYDSETFYYYN